MPAGGDRERVVVAVLDASDTEAALEIDHSTIDGRQLHALRIEHESRVRTTIEFRDDAAARVDDVGVAQDAKRRAGNGSVDEVVRDRSDAAADQCGHSSELWTEPIELTIRKPKLGVVREGLARHGARQSEGSGCCSDDPAITGSSIVLVSP